MNRGIATVHFSALADRNRSLQFQLSCLATRADMELIRVILLSLYLFTQTNCLPEPGNTHHHIHHRIHVPEKIHKVYHTKIVKVPEHHHYFHEKEKIIKVEVPKKEEPHYPPLKSEEFSGYEDHHSYYGDGEHNIFKKHATISSSRKLRRRKVPRNVKH